MIKDALLYRKLLSGKKVQCYLCAHQCILAEDAFGICGVRQNVKGKLQTLVFGDLVAEHVDPVEKKPLYHFMPGSKTYSIATVGCNLKCSFCQNWQISQSSKKDSQMTAGEFTAPEEIVRRAVEAGCKSVSYTYTEPTVYFELAYETSKLAAEKGLKNVFVSNGFMTAEAIDLIRPYLHAANIDLKSFREETYRNVCKGSLEPVLQSIAHLKKRGVWVEVTTLLVPGMNDSEAEIHDIAKFIASVGKDIPWRISRFHPDFHLTDVTVTPVEALKWAGEIGRSKGLKYVYLGNVSEGNNTICPMCVKVVVARKGFDVTTYHVRDGKCEFCGNALEGVWK